MGTIEIRDLHFAYRDHNVSYPVLSGLNLRVEDGEFVCVIGKSGCGKSTLLSLLAGLRMPTSGRISIDGAAVTGTGTDRAVVFQHGSLFPWMTARENVAFGIRQSRKDVGKKEARRMADAFLADLGMAGENDKYPYQLSGGMQQRVAIARALAVDAGILLLDEPFGALDARTRLELQRLLEGVSTCSPDGRKARKTVVFVTHDIDEALLLGDRVLFMASGRIEHDVRVPFPRPGRFEDREPGDLLLDFKKGLLSLFYLCDADERTA